MNEFIKVIKKKMIDAGIDNFKELAKEVGLKYDTMLVRLKDPSSFRIYEIKALARNLNLTNEELLLIVKGE